MKFNEKEICELYKSGKSLRDISLQFNSSPQIIRRILVKNEILIRSKGHINSKFHPWKEAYSFKTASQKKLMQKELGRL